MTARLSDTDLAEIKQRADKATEGPWTVERCGYSAALPGVADVWHDSEEGYVYPLALEDAEFIAAARSDVPALVAEVEALRAELREEQEYNVRLTDEIEECDVLAVRADRDRLLALLDPDNDEAVEVGAQQMVEVDRNIGLLSHQPLDIEAARILLRSALAALKLRTAANREG